MICRRHAFSLSSSPLVQLRHLRLVIVLAKGEEAAVTFRENASGKRLFPDISILRLFRRTFGSSPSSIFMRV